MSTPSRKARRTAALAAGAAVAASGLLAGCGTTTTLQEVASSAAAILESANPMQTEAASPSPEAGMQSPEAGMAESATTPLGGTYTWEDGLKVTVSEPSSYRPSDTAAYDKAPAYVSFTVTIENGTQDAYDPSSFLTSVQSGTSEGSQIFDTAKGLNGAPSTKVLSGRSVEFLIGYSVEDPNDIVMEVRPGFDSESAIFTS